MTRPPENAQQTAEYAARVRSALASLPSLGWVSALRDTTNRLAPALERGLGGSAWGQPSRAIAALRHVERLLSRSLDLSAAAIARSSTHLAHNGAGTVSPTVASWEGGRPGTIPANPEENVRSLSLFVNGCQKLLRPETLAQASGQVATARSHLAAAATSLPSSVVLGALELGPAQGLLSHNKQLLDEAAAETAVAAQALQEYLLGALGRPIEAPASSASQPRSDGHGVGERRRDATGETQKKREGQKSATPSEEAPASKDPETPAHPGDPDGPRTR